MELLLSCFTFARMLESSTRMLDTDAGGRRAAARALGVTITRTTLRTPVRCHGTARMGARTDVRDDVGLAGIVDVSALAQELFHDQVCTPAGGGGPHPPLSASFFSIPKILIHFGKKKQTGF